MTHKECQVYYITWHVKGVKYDIIVDTKIMLRDIIFDGILVSNNGIILDSLLLDTF